MLDLQAGIGLNEVILGTICQIRGVYKELKSSQAPIVHRRRKPLCGGDNPRPQAAWKVWRRRNLHHLLISTLDAAFTLTKIGNGPGAIAENLHLDVSRPRDQPLRE